MMIMLGLGAFFLPNNPEQRERCKKAVAEICAEEGQEFVGWREVPTDAAEADLGPTASAAAPCIEQLFVAAGPGLAGDAFERKLYLIRKRASHLLRNDWKMSEAKAFYICSLSTKVLIYKGMLTPELKDEGIAIIDATFMKSGDPLKAYKETITAGSDEIVCSWSNMREPMMLHTQPGTPAGRPYGLCTVFVPALEASFSINGKQAAGKAWPRDRDGRPFSTSSLAFSESWTEAS